MHQPALPTPYNPKPVERMNVSLRYRWETDYYVLRVARIIDGSDEWHVAVYEDLTLDEALDVVLASVAG
jgi:hypothetical protein